VLPGATTLTVELGVFIAGYGRVSPLMRLREMCVKIEHDPSWLVRDVAIEYLPLQPWCTIDTAYYLSKGHLTRRKQYGIWLIDGRKYKCLLLIVAHPG
jgi:hypothetical protein